MGIVQFIQRYPIFLSLALFLVAWTTLLFFISPEELVANIGVTNVYLVIFLLAVFGGMSSFTGPSFFVAVGTAALGGADPLILALTGGVGLLISDTVFYYAALRGRRVLERYWQEWVDWAVGIVGSLPRFAVFGGTYAYMGLSPLPNDVLMVVLALSKYPFWQLAPCMVAGNITLICVVSYAAIGGGTWLSAFGF